MKKILFLIFSNLLISNLIADPINRFCGFYGGANINFGPIIFQSVSNSTNQAFFNTSINNLIPLTGKATNNVCEVVYQALDTLGAGITFGYHTIYCCKWLVGAEFNGLFYGDLRCTAMISDTAVDANITNATVSTNLNTKFDRQRTFESNIRFDGVLKLGILTTPNSSFYLLAGGSGIRVSENNSINLNVDASSTSSSAINNLANINEPIKINDCTWLGGGVLGIGLKIACSTCIDLFIESRYSKYKTWFRAGQDQESSSNSRTTETETFTNDFNIAHHIEAYSTLIGLNWSF